MLIVLIVHPAKFKPGVALAVDLVTVPEAEDVMAADSKDEVVDVNLLFL